MWKQLLSSSLGRKLFMALTGLFLSTFLIVHMSGNLSLFKDDQGLAFNKYAVFMTTFPVIKAVSYGLYLLIILHAVDGLYLAYTNRKARPVQYGNINGSSSWASRNMAVLGTILLVFLVVHMSDFWASYKFGHVPFKQYVFNLQEDKIVSTQAMPADYTQQTKMVTYSNEATGTETIIVKDLYAQVAETFKNLPMVLLYLLAMVSVGFHLAHGFASSFQTLGLNHPKYNGFIKGLSTVVFGILIPLGFALMPIFFYIKSLN
jgi:succinate dehydrogenase / fumarate reductase cytochrome b subunit